MIVSLCSKSSQPKREGEIHRRQRDGNRRRREKQRKQNDLQELLLTGDKGSLKWVFGGTWRNVDVHINDVCECARAA